MEGLLRTLALEMSLAASTDKKTSCNEAGADFMCCIKRPNNWRSAADASPPLQKLT